MLNSSEVLHRLDDVQKICSKLMALEFKKHHGNPVVKAIESGLQKRIWTSVRDAAAFLRTSPAEITQIHSRIVKMDIGKIVEYALRLDVRFEPVNPQQIFETVATAILKKMQEVRRDAGEAVTLNLDRETMQRILADIEEELPGVDSEYKRTVNDCRELLDVLNIFVEGAAVLGNTWFEQEVIECGWRWNRAIEQFQKKNPAS